MESLARISSEDIRNGLLNKMLANAGITDVQQYVKDFHHETEEVIIHDLDQEANSSQSSQDEEIVTPADLSSWLTGVRPRLEGSIEAQPLEKKEQPVETKIKPTGLSSWAQQMIPNSNSLSSSNLSSTDVVQSEENVRVSGNLNTWLTDWSKNLTQQVPTSLDTWLQNLVPTNVNEPLEKTKDSKKRLNAYLNAAQKVLSKHGYKLPESNSAPIKAPQKTGFISNVKNMYFMWKFLDKNNDQVITVHDFELLLAELGLNFLSKPLAMALFEMLDTNHDGKLQFRDFIALIGIIGDLISAK